MAKNLAKMKGGKGGGAGRNWETTPTLEEGMYPARLVQYIDIGKQPQKPFKGKDKPPVYMARLAYELVDEFMLDEDGNPDTEKPRWVFETLPLHSLESERAKSTLRLKALDPKNDTGGVLQYCINFPCQVQIVHGKNKKDPDHPYENIGAVSGPPRRGEVDPLVNDPVVFDMDEPDMEVFEGLAEFIQDQIKAALDFDESPMAALVDPKAPAKKKVEEPADESPAEEDDLDDECPF